MFENIIKFFKNIGKKDEKKQSQENSKDAAKERLHLVKGYPHNSIVVFTVDIAVSF